MKAENALRTVRNSLLCFFTALGVGLLAACGGGGGGGASTFSTYLTDAAVEGAEYSGPTSSDVTGKGGVFTASEGVFEFSVGATTLGSVRLSSDWAESHVTPADFIGVDTPAEVVSVARIVQGLDNDGIPGNGISISQSVRDGLTVDLFTRLITTGTIIVNLGSVNLTIPPAADARDHLIATRQCLFSGGYMGGYRSTVASESPAEGRSHFVFGPRTDQGLIRDAGIRLKGVEIPISSDGSSGDAGLDQALIANVGVRGTTFASDAGNVGRLNGGMWTFVTPRLITGIWTDDEGDDTDSGTYRLTRVADTGDPTANRRVVGVETEASSVQNARTPVGIYVLDYFADDREFRGQYYDVGTDQYSVLLLTVADGVWPTEAGIAESTKLLTLSGTLGGEDTNITVQVIRDTNTRGSFEGGVTGADSTIDGSWCDLVIAATGGGGNVQSAPAQSKIEVDWRVGSLAVSRSRIGGDVSTHRLSRYLDSGFPANTAIDGIQILG